MNPHAIDEAYVTAAAGAVGMEIPPQELAAVTEHLRRIAAVAAPVLATSLPIEAELAPVWRP